MPKYLALDLDGTLVDMDLAHFEALNAALALDGPRATITWEEHMTIFKGLPTRRKLAMLVEMGRLPPAMVDLVSRRKQAETLVRIERLIMPDPEKHQLLAQLHIDGWHLCVCSNAVRESVGAMLAVSGLFAYLEFCLSNQDAPPKPDPGIYLLAARIWGIPPEQMVVVEDAAPGKEAAVRAGCQLVEVTCPADVTLALLPAIQAAQARIEAEQFASAIV